LVYAAKWTTLRLVSRPIKFKFSAHKAYAAMHWMARQQQRLDLHALLKSCYFADKAHLNKHNRPVFGATYRAMRFGPVPMEIYEMAKGEALWLPEIGVDRYPWKLEGYHLILQDNREPDLSALSESDFAELTTAFGACTRILFDARTESTHGPDWRAAEFGYMKYEDMLEETERKSQIVEYLQENARFMRL
jgi:hypothetical protein